MSDQQLMNLLKFDEVELQANRNGRLSEKQKVRLQKMEAVDKRRSFLGCAGNAFVALIGLGGAATHIVTMTREGSGLDFGMICFGSIFGILWPVGTSRILGSAPYIR